jgi:hypothetical protein
MGIKRSLIHTKKNKSNEDNNTTLRISKEINRQMINLYLEKTKGNINSNKNKRSKISHSMAIITHPIVKKI